MESDNNDCAMSAVLGLTVLFIFQTAWHLSMALVRGSRGLRLDRECLVGVACWGKAEDEWPDYEWESALSICVILTTEHTEVVDRAAVVWVNEDVLAIRATLQEDATVSAFDGVLQKAFGKWAEKSAGNLNLVRMGAYEQGIAECARQMKAYRVDPATVLQKEEEKQKKTKKV